MTTVGSAGPLSDSYYGTADQGGNVWEWNEVLIAGSFRGLRGGSWDEIFAFVLQSSFRFNGNPSGEGDFVGFRVATVPEPSTYVLAAMGIVALLFAHRGSDEAKSPCSNQSRPAMLVFHGWSFSKPYAAPRPWAFSMRTANS